ncbi:cell envelope biogenesis protein TonB [Sulfurifustis variabilis]|uniref:Protein TonB n=1 Tax=Sulfurifustis variabilis TaxID=1675686 RepID=A0A1B4VCS4_9GAMM|nr:energy transducer TonB [Sulfurifustis variabilis]BAU46777.1 cell envelope biogenesis protein TonB [Sulfurifustis variabilis]
MRSFAADRRLPPALGFSLLAHVAFFLAFRPPVPDQLARHVSQIVDVHFAAIAPLPEVAPQPAARPRHAKKPPTARPAPPPEPRSVRTAEAAPEPAPATEPAAQEETTPTSAEPVPEPAHVPSETPSTSSAPPAAPIAEARYEVRGLDNPKPPYPLAARRQGIEGRVLLTAHVRADGSCRDVRLKQSSGHSLLDRAALDTVKRWRFLPASRAGNAIDSWVDVPIRFRLEDRA